MKTAVKNLGLWWPINTNPVKDLEIEITTRGDGGDRKEATRRDQDDIVANHMDSGEDPAMWIR